MSNIKLGIIYVIIATLGYSLINIFMKLGINSGLNGLYITGTAFLISSLIFWIIIFATRRTTNFSYLYLNICAVASIGIYYFATKALNLVSASLYTIIFFTYPIFTIILSRIFFKNRISKIKLLSLIISMFGLCLTIGIFQEGLIKFSTLGAIYSLITALATSVYYISLQKALEKTDSIASNAYVFSITAVFCILYCVFTGQFTITPSVVQISYIVLLALISFTLAATFMVKGISMVGADTASIVNLFQPPITLILAYIIFKDHMTFVQIIGGILILASLFVLGMEKGEKPA